MSSPTRATETKAEEAQDNKGDATFTIVLDEASFADLASPRIFFQALQV